MSKEEKERRCKSCRKLLLDEKLPFCRRCILEARNKVGPVAVMGSVGFAMAHLHNTVAFLNSDSGSNDDATDGNDDITI